MEIGNYRTMVMIAGSILLLVLINPFGSANPIPWYDHKVGASPTARPINTNVTFFKEFVKVDINENKTILLHADYWFRNEGVFNQTIKILLPLSEAPMHVVLSEDDSEMEWERSTYIGYEAAAFDIFLSKNEEVKVTLEFWDDLTYYEYPSESNHIAYSYSYLVGTAREWNRGLENASFEFSIPITVYGDNDYNGWDRNVNGSDYVFTKEYSKWLPAENEDFVSLYWEEYKPTPEEKQGGHDTSGTILIIVVISVIVLIMVAVVTISVIFLRKKKREIQQ